MSINITVTPTTGGSFTAAGVESGNITLTVGGGIGPPGSGNVALAAGAGIAITSTANVATITSTVQGVSASNLADLADVDATAPTSGQVLEWNGTAWAPGLDSTLTLASTGGSDLGASTAGTSSEAARADHVHNLPALADLVGVSLGTPSTGQVLAYNGTAWAPAADNALTLSSDAGADLGTAAAGSAGVAARADHVHNLPTFAEITNGTASVTGNLTLNASTGGVIVNGGTAAGSLTLNCEQNTHGVTIASPAHSVGASYTLTLPATAGSANQVLTTDGSGSLSWSNGTSGSGGISWSSVPSDSNANGTAGDVAYDSQGYFYLHDGTSWRRIQLATFGVVPITITQQPQSASVEDGQQATFTVLANGPEAISYQWSSSTDGVSFAAINGATSNTLAINATLADNGSQYRALLSAAGAADVTTNIATLTVNETFRLLTANNDTLMTEAGDTLNHDGVGGGGGGGGGSSGNWSLVNSEIEPYRSTGWLQFGGNGTLVSPYQEGNDLVLADNGTAWQSSLTRDQYDSLLGGSYAADTQLKFITRNSGGDLNAELLLARDESVAFGIAVYTDTLARYIYRLRLQSGAWVKSPAYGLGYGQSHDALLAACSRSGDYFVVAFNAGFIDVYDLSAASWSQLDSVYLGSDFTDYTQIRRLGISNDGSVCSVAFKNTHDANSNKFDRIRRFEHVFNTESPNGVWVETNTLTVADSYVCDWTADHSRVVVGQYDYAGGGAEKGRVQVFSLSGSTWSQVGSDIVGTANYDHLGYSVSISSDGNTIAIGVRGEDDAGINAGAARVYEWSGSDWQQVDADIDGEAAGDYAGDQVELSGGRVAISAPGADGAGTDRGQVRVFSAT